MLHSFSYSTSDGAAPYGGVVFDNKGNLYGTAAFEGAHGQGVVFELTPGSNGAWNEQIVYSFSGGSGAGSPFAGIVLDNAGNIYGFSQGGADNAGVAYELVKSSNGTWTEKILHTFTNENDGSEAFGSVPVLDAAGNVYGVAYGGPHDYGIVFELSRDSNGSWKETVLYAATGGSDGSVPYALTFDTAGNLYCVSPYTVFELMSNSNETWTQKILYSFKGGADGAYPESPLIFDKSGNLYGTTNSGGHHRGTVFELSPGSNGRWTEKILHRFTPTGGDGVSPGLAGLAMDASGNLYGTTYEGGAANAGVVFEVTP